MNVEIGSAGVTDLPGVMAIENVAFADPWSSRAFRDAIENPLFYFVCARANERVVGYVVAWFVAGEGEISNIAVSPVAWGHGVGRTLLDAALNEGSRRSAGAVYLEVRESNERARALYDSSGFEEVGRRKGYYRRPIEDAIMLRRTLVSDL
ncbi:MAG: ribosomal protein S18-alanine N-acetyltransferase [Gemmatimonadaceae bacterium]